MSKLFASVVAGLLAVGQYAVAAEWNIGVDEVYPVRTVRSDHNERPRGWLNPISPIPFVHRTTIGRDAAATLFLGVPRGAVSLGIEELEPFRFYAPAKLVDNPTTEFETRDANSLNAVLGIYAHSRDKRTLFGRKQTYNRIVKFDSYVRFPMGYPLNNEFADRLIRAELQFNEVTAGLNASPGCGPAVSGIQLLNTVPDLFASPPDSIDDISLDNFESRLLVDGRDYRRISANRFDITNLVQDWMRATTGVTPPFGLILIGAENPRPRGLTNEPNVGKHRKRRHAVRWLRVGDYRLDNNEWEFVCYFNAENLNILLEF